MDTKADWKFVWSETVPHGHLSQTFITSVSGRRLLLNEPRDLRFHPDAEFGRFEAPALAALIRNHLTGIGTAVHLTALSDDGLAPRVFPDGTPSTKIIGESRGGAVRLGGPDLSIVITVGIEPALCVQHHFDMPAWALLSLEDLATFPVIDPVELLLICCDHTDEVLRAARVCMDRYTQTSRRAEIHYPTEAGGNWHVCGLRQLEKFGRSLDLQELP